MNEIVKKLWPELAWIGDELLREKTAQTWELALQRSVLTAEDLGKSLSHFYVAHRPGSLLYGSQEMRCTYSKSKPVKR